MSTHDEDVRAAIMRNARAAERERLTNEARRQWPNATDEELAEHVAQLVRVKAIAGGKKGAAAVRHRLAVAREFTHAQDRLVSMAEALIAAIRACADVQDTCDHVWPDDVDHNPNAYCQLCGLAWLPGVPARAA